MSSATKLMKYDGWVRAFFLTGAKKQTRESVMGSRKCAQGQPQCGDTQGEESGRTCAKRQVRDSTDQALVSDQSADHKCTPETLLFNKFDNWIEMGSTAVHMKPFSMIERVKHLGSTNSLPTADAK